MCEKGAGLFSALLQFSLVVNADIVLTCSTIPCDRLFCVGCHDLGVRADINGAPNKQHMPITESNTDAAGVIGTWKPIVCVSRRRASGRKIDVARTADARGQRRTKTRRSTGACKEKHRELCDDRRIYVGLDNRRGLWITRWPFSNWIC